MRFQKNTKIALLSFTCLWVMTVPVMAQDGAKSSFAQMAANSNRFEVEAARIALEKGRDQSAKDFAKDMLHDHTKSMEDLEQAAKNEGIALPSALDAEHMTKLEALNQAAESDFDQAYLSTQVAAHEDTVRLFMTYSQDGPDGALKNYATQSVGTLRTHNIRIHGLANQ